MTLLLLLFIMNIITSTSVITTVNICTFTWVGYRFWCLNKCWSLMQDGTLISASAFSKWQTNRVLTLLTHRSDTGHPWTEQEKFLWHSHHLQTSSDTYCSACPRWTPRLALWHTYRGISVYHTVWTAVRIQRVRSQSVQMWNVFDWIKLGVTADQLS